MKNWKLSKEDYLRNLYAHIKERVTNPRKYRVRGQKLHHYYKLPVCSQSEFMAFAVKSKRFDNIFKQYKLSRGQRKYAPSIDRINNKKGYTLGNMQFLTLPENSGKNTPKKVIFIKNSRTGKVYGFAKTRSVSKFLNQQGRVNLRYKSFTNLKTGVKFINVTKKAYARAR